MNTLKHIGEKQALRAALVCAGLEDCEYRCLGLGLENDCFHIVVLTPYMRYEFYVDASGQVVGIGTEPVSWEDALRFPLCGEEGAVLAA